MSPELKKTTFVAGDEEEQSRRVALSMTTSSELGRVC
jgi:hypothetical protein